ncbi:S-layer homology domain-containing protein [Paenibacillus sp. YPG26]|uniref:S-layer homology domain-containing protein n=1 Tax=Paenibacillus sp. YPG26 TaxID=2878915 RepID=UPI00203FE7D6|nr:S-layer homology domain-containing protein [Paenibacillus sp. YPG26]USB33169.1 S-layer homology domain-containing protein [Paenibacillus sp. YPG26]
MNRNLKLRNWLSILMISSMVLGSALPAAGAAEETGAIPSPVTATGGTAEGASATGTGGEAPVEENSEQAARDEQTEPALTPTYTAPTNGSPKLLTEQVNTPALLITQIVPDTSNIPELLPDGTPSSTGSVDGYESIEVYNNTTKEVDFEQYDFYYVNGSTETKWAVNSGSAVKIPPREAVVFWVQNSSNQELAADSFNTNYTRADYTSSLVEGKNLFRQQGGNGMANTGTRSLIIRTKQGADLVKAEYTIASGKSKANHGIRFGYPVDGGLKMIMEAQPESLPATPGQLQESQIPPQPSTPEEPGTGTLQITHVPAAQAQGLKDLPITAQIQNPDNTSGSSLSAELLYKTPSQARYKVIPLPQKGGSEYSAVIPAAALAESKLDYKIRVNSVEQAYSVDVDLPAFDPVKAPVLLVTKVVPNTTNVPGTSSDAYEFIEVYNNTDQPVDFNNYKVYYRYPDSGIQADAKWPSNKEQFIIPAGKSVVFWIKNGANASYTAADFNAFYQTSLTLDSNLFTIESGGLANSGRRAVVIKTNTEKEVSAAYYDADTLYEGGTKGDETKENTALLYKYPVSGTTMIKMSSGLVKAVPGVDNEAVPSTPVHVEPDLQAPTVKDLTGITTVDQSKSIDLKVDAKDDKQVVSVKIYTKSDKQQDFVEHNLAEDYGDRLYHYPLSSADLIGRKSLTYYFAASDGTQVIKSETKIISITGGPSGEDLRLNFKDGDLVKDTRTLKGAARNTAPGSLKLSIDGKEISKEAYAALEHDAYFVFDAKNVDYYFKNAVTMGEPAAGSEDKTILYTFLDPIPTYTTLSYPIDADRLQLGTDNVIYIRAGSKSSPFDPRPGENKDDFEIRNVRLLLADGTEIWDPAYSTPDKEIKMGDSSGKSESIGFRFNLTSSMLQAQAYSWDTKNYEDGVHQVKVENQEKSLAAKVTVDNTPPSITPNLEEGKEYRGAFTINAKIEDKLAGVDQVEVKLDGEVIHLPYAATSGTLKPGPHELSIQAADTIGNTTQTKVTFKVPNENPLNPELVAPAQGQSSLGNNAKLTVKVQDPTGDPLKISFYKGFKYDGSRAEGFAGYKNASVTEPPREKVPAGELALTEEEYAQISKLDGKYLVNDSDEKFPYQRFEVKLDPTVKSTDQVEIEWKGKSLEGRKVSLYAWSKSSGVWELLDHVIAGSEDFQLHAKVTAGKYADGQVIQVLVQDEIASPAAAKSGPITEDPYDFSFIWMSDTQYYSQSFPYIYQKNVKWIADNKDKLNLKYVIHTGDIVDKSYQEYQWQEADKNMKVLENADIPYGVLAGNHDVNHQENDYTKYWEYFGESRFKNMPTFAGSYKNNRGHYDLVSAGGNDFIIVYMGWGLGDKEIEWMNEIVSKYPERKAILALHEYMLVSNNRAPIADKIYEKVVLPNKNVFATLSGHYHDAQLKVDEIDDNGDKVPDRKVYQMLADYQGAPEGGLGYIRLMQFDMKNNKLHMKTYSPYLDKYNFYDPAENPKYQGKDEFSLDLDLQPRTKRVATDYFGVKVYTDQLIGSSLNVKSGSQTSVQWNSLQPDSYIQWYVKAEDGFSGSKLSDIWGFYSGKSTDGGGMPGNPGNNPSEGSSPAPVQPTVPGAKPGAIEVKASGDGTYTITDEAMKKAASEAADGKVQVELKGSTGGQQNSRLVMDTAALQSVTDRKLTMEIISPTAALTLPGSSLPKGLAEADKLVVDIDTTLDSDMKARLTAAAGSRGELTSNGLVFNLGMTLAKGQSAAAIHQLSGPVTITRTLTDEQKTQLNRDYAGVYKLSAGQAEYIGGQFSGSTVSFTTDQLGEFAIMEYHKRFADLSGGWADEFITKLAAKHIITEIDENRFGPNQDITRADFAILAVRSLTEQASESTSAFEDVTSNAYFSGYIAKAAELGIMQGSGGQFRPMDPITREEAAAVLMNLAGRMNKTPQTSGSSAAFTDTSEISGWAKSAVVQAQALGLINGKGGNRFDPKDQVTRAELSKMLYKLLAYPSSSN